MQMLISLDGSLYEWWLLVGNGHGIGGCWGVGMKFEDSGSVCSMHL